MRLCGYRKVYFLQKWMSLPSDQKRCTMRKRSDAVAKFYIFLNYLTVYDCQSRRDEKHIAFSFCLQLKRVCIEFRTDAVNILQLLWNFQTLTFVLVHITNHIDVNDRMISVAYYFVNRINLDQQARLVEITLEDHQQKFK